MEKVKPPKIEVGNLDAFADKAINDLRSDSAVYNNIKAMNVTPEQVRAHLASFLDYQEDYHYCQNCPGVDQCQKPHPHLQLKLSLDGNFVERSFDPCEKIIRKWEQDRQYRISDFPIEWREAFLGNIDMTANRMAIVKAADEVIEGKAKRWLYLTGNPRMGKSYMMVAIINELIRNGQGPVEFLNTPTRLKELNDLAFTDKEGFKKTFDDYANVPVLVFDDFGNEYKNDYMRDTILYPILSERSKNGRLTFFTSDFTINEIGQMYSVSKASEIRAKQLARLLVSMCREPLKLDGISVY